MRFTLFFAVFLIALTAGRVAQGATKTAVFAGGCFWCMEADFEKLKGVVKVISGYAGGDSTNPTYEEVSSGETSYAESVEVVYDPEQVKYERLLDYFWHHIDPTQKDRQFCDKGRQYRTAIFYQDKKQQKLAESSKKALKDSGRLKEIYTEVAPVKMFYPAEDYHQDYYKKNPIRYRFYRFNCGRDKRVKQVWHDKD